MPVIVTYAEGFPTKLLKHGELENLINEKGSPTYNPGKAVWMWADGTEYRLKQPYAGDKRLVTGLSTEPWTESDRKLLYNLYGEIAGTSQRDRKQPVELRNIGSNTGPSNSYRSSYRRCSCRYCR